MILCAGEALVDMLPRRSTDNEACFAPVVGGAVFNTAIALARLGAPSALFTGLSRDLFGRQLDAALQADGVHSDHAKRSDRPTTLAFVELTDGHASYAFYDEATAGRMLSEEDLPSASDIAPIDALFFGGISLMVEPCARAYTALAHRETGRRPLMIDPNIRPSFIADPDAYRTRILGLIAVADIVKVSDEDLGWLMGSGTTLEQAQDLLSRGPKVVCVTEGAQGVTSFSGHGQIKVAARPAEVVDTVGAGDTFNAGLLAGLHEAGALGPGSFSLPAPETLRGALELGVAAAAVTVARAGANPPRRNELA